MFSFFKKKKIISEERFFKFQHKWHMARYFDNGDIDLLSHNVNTKEEMNLGKIIDGQWQQPEGYQSFYMGDFRSTQKLVDMYFRRSKVAVQKGATYTREDFVRWGKSGQDTVKRKTGKPSVVHRWENKK